MDYEEEVRHQQFDAEQKFKKERMAIKRLAIISIALIIFGGMIALSGCATRLTLEELEAEAVVTGDWTLVERREKAIARRNLHDARVAFCKEQGKMLVTFERGAMKTWSCADKDRLMDEINRMF